MNRYFLPIVMMLLIGNVQAEGWYRWVDKSGNVHYSDAPPADVVAVQKKGTGVAQPADNADLPYETRRARQNFPVALYVIENCGDICQQARDLLNRRGIPYSEISLKTQEEFDEFRKMSDSAGVPVLTVGKIWLKSFQAEQWNSELDIAGYPKTAPYTSAKAAKTTEETSNPTP